MDLQITNRTALITGASQGIGLATADVLAREGANVVIVAREQHQLDAALEQLRANATGEVDAVAADVTNPDAIARAVDAAASRFGTVDILVNNAGGVSNFGSFDEIADADWQDAFTLNLLSAVRGCRLVLPQMRSRDWGRIVNVSSESALQPDAEFPHYAAAKAALLNLTKSLSKATAGTGIRVNAVSPAFVMTAAIERLLEDQARAKGIGRAEAEQQLAQQQRPGITVARAASPYEVANIIAVLCSEAASFVNGTNVRVDSGAVGAV